MKYDFVGTRFPKDLIDAVKEIYNAAPNEKQLTGIGRWNSNDLFTLAYYFKPPLTKEQAKEITDKFFELGIGDIEVRGVRESIDKCTTSQDNTIPQK